RRRGHAEGLGGELRLSRARPAARRRHAHDDGPAIVQKRESLLHRKSQSPRVDRKDLVEALFRGLGKRLPKPLHASVRRVLRRRWELDDADKAARVPASIANARARSVAAPIANREPQKSTAEGRKCGHLKRE